MGTGTAAGDKGNPLLQADRATSLGTLLDQAGTGHAGEWGHVQWCCLGNAVNKEFHQCCPSPAGSNLEYSQTTAENRRQVGFGFKISIYTKHQLNRF